MTLKERAQQLMRELGIVEWRGSIPFYESGQHELIEAALLEVRQETDKKWLSIIAKERAKSAWSNP